LGDQDDFDVTSSDINNVMDRCVFIHFFHAFYTLLSCVFIHH